ncbi:MAG: aminotransferase [Desulfuromonadia bacterium]
MAYQFSSVVSRVISPPIGEIIRLRRSLPAGIDPIDLCQAVPDYPPEPGLVRHLTAVVSDPATCRYTPDEGLPTVREALARRYGRIYGAAIPPDSFILTIGASQAFWLAILVTSPPGSEVIVQSPAYFDHPMALESLGVTPRFTPYDTRHPGLPDPDAIRRNITPRTTGIVIVTPSNPTGTVTPPQILEEIFDLAAERGIFLLLDETYGDFTDPPPHRLFSRPDWDQTLIHVVSFGKSYALTGYRAGAIAGSPCLVGEAMKIQDSQVVCQPRITQEALLYALDHLDGWVRERREELRRRNDLFVRLMTGSRAPFRIAANGSFFAWVEHPFRGESGWDAARRLAIEHGILSLPGEIFGPGLEPYLRLALGNMGEETIPVAVDRLARVR